MREFILFLDAHSGSLTFIVTAVYVVATIVICAANIKSAKATRDQLAESKRQFEEQNRAFITHEFIYENRTWYGMRFTNHGKRIARHVKIELNPSFLDSLTESTYKTQLKRLHGKEFLLGIEQSYDIYFGTDEFRENEHKLPIEGDIIYIDDVSNYREHFCVDFNDYPPIFTVETDEEKILDEMKKQTKKLESIRSELHRLNTVTNQEKEKNV